MAACTPTLRWHCPFVLATSPLRHLYTPAHHHALRAMPVMSCPLLLLCPPFAPVWPWIHVFLCAAMPVPCSHHLHPLCPVSSTQVHPSVVHRHLCTPTSACLSCSASTAQPYPPPPVLLHNSGTAKPPASLPCSYAPCIPPPPHHHAVSLHPLPCRYIHTTASHSRMHHSALLPLYAGLLRPVPSLHLGTALGPPASTMSTLPPTPVRPAPLNIDAVPRLVDRCPLLLDTDS